MEDHDEKVVLKLQELGGSVYLSIMQGFVLLGMLAKTRRC